MTNEPENVPTEVLPGKCNEVTTHDTACVSFEHIFLEHDCSFYWRKSERRCMCMREREIYI